MAALFYAAAALFLLTPSAAAEDIPYRVDPQTGGQIIDLDGPAPAATGGQPRVTDPDAPRVTVQGARAASAQGPRFVPGLPPETVGAFDPWRAHENMPQATAADFEEQSRINRAEEAARRRASPTATAPAADTASHVQKPTAADLDEMMKKMMDPSIDALEKKRLAAVVFYHQDIYRKAAMLGEFKGDSPQVKAFLEQKKLLQEEIISRMGPKYKQQFGEPFKQPVIPFDYNNILSDDDIITGTGEPGRRAEKIYNESLNDVMRQHVGRPMDALDRKRVDVNGLAWNMTQEAAHLDFSHHEKYINPQSGFANQRKLMEGAQAGKVTAFTFDDQGRMIKLTPAQTVEEIKRLAVDAPMQIPGIDATRGSGSMSDFLRMAEMHQIKPSGRVTVEEVQQFLRNQKYSERVIGDYTDIFQQDARLAKEHQAFIESSAKLRKAMTVREAAEILEKAYGTKIIQRSGAIDYDALTSVMLKHQERQLTTVLPGMIAEVTKTEAYKIVEYLKTAGKASRNKLRKEMALTYAPMDDDTVKKITAQLDSMSIDEADKKFLKSVVQDDSRQIRRYAQLLEIPTHELTTRLKIDGDNLAAADFISKTAKVKPLTDALSARKGGGTFKQFLESKTAKALNLDVMLSPDAKGAKYMQWSMLLLATSRAYNAAGSGEEGLKAMGMATFEMVPFVASVLRFSEMEYKQAFLEFAMDIYPPTALANIAVTILNYAAHTAKSTFVESKWEQLARSVLDEMTDEDFVKSDIEGYWRLKNRGQLLEYLDEVSPGLGRVAKLSALIEPDIDARMTRHPDVQTNNAAIHTLQWFQEFDVAGITLKYKKMFDLEQLRSRVYETGIPAAGSASPVERVAARILMDNLRIRKELYYQVLNDFMDRIEKLYNAAKEQEEGGYGAIVGKALAALKELYENAPQKIKDSPWGTEKLKEDYRGRVEYLTKYKPQPADKPALDIQREMQEIIDDFKEFIKKLAVVVDIQEEMRYLDLKAHVYGGTDSFEAEDYLLLGSPFRAGISARVSPKRKDLKWTVYYYALSHETGNIKLLGSVRLEPRKFSPGNEGYWVIEAPHKDTFLTVDEKLIDEFFSKERWYFIRPVIAFGDWPSDPLSMVGADALKNPIEHPDLFNEKRAAFVGERAEFGTWRGLIHAEAPDWIYRDDAARLKVTLRLPPYAQKGRHHASVESFAMMKESPLPRLNPAKVSPVASDNYDPPQNFSFIDINFPTDAEDTSFGITVKAGLENIKEDYWPVAKTLIVNYVNKNNPANQSEELEGDGAGEEAVSLNAALAQLEALAAKAETLKAQADEMNKTITANARTLEKDLKSLQDALQQLSSEVNGLEGTLAKGSADAAGIRSEERFVFGRGQTLGGIRGTIETDTLSACEVYEQIKATDRLEQLDKLIGLARTYFASVGAQYSDYQAKKGDIDGAKGRVEAERGKAGSGENTLGGYEARLSDAQGRLDAARGQQGVVENLTAAIQGYVSEAEKITQEAVALADAAGSDDKKNASKDDKRSLKQIDRLLSGIKKSQSGVIRSAGAVGAKKDFLLASIETAANSLTQTRAALDGLKQKYAGDQFKQQLDAALKEFQATYDAADLFTESIENANRNARICMDGIQSQYDRKATPEARVAQTDCSRWPGSTARWDAASSRVQCDCPSGQVWVESRNSCYDRVAAAVESIDCSVYPNSEPRWSEADQRALCYCASGHEWNRDRNRCIVERRTQVAQTNCSMYGPSEAYWDTAQDRVLCGCSQGYAWNSNMTYCVESRDSQVARTNCSGYGPASYPYWDNARNQPLCACRPGYRWNSSYTYCEQEPRYGADDFARDVNTIINTMQGGTGGSGGGGSGTVGSTTQSGCTPGRTAAEIVMNQALGCPDTGSAGGSTNTGGGWTNTGYQGGGTTSGGSSGTGTGEFPVNTGGSGGSFHRQCCANGMEEFLGQGVCMDGSPVVGPCRN